MCVLTATLLYVPINVNDLETNSTGNLHLRRNVKNVAFINVNYTHRMQYVTYDTCVQ